MYKNVGKTILLSMIIFLVFLVTGCPNPVNDTSTQYVAAAKEALAVGYSEGDAATSVTANVTLASSGEKEVTITWTSDNAAVGTTGVVTRPKAGESDITVTLTATLAKNTVSDTKAFTLTVIAIPDTTPPAEVTNLSAAEGNAEITLSWTNPADADFTGVKISAEGIEETTITKEKTTSSITGLTNGKEYTFTVKTYDTTSNTSTGTTVMATPADLSGPDFEVTTTTLGNELRIKLPSNTKQINVNRLPKDGTYQPAYMTIFKLYSTGSSMSSEYHTFLDPYVILEKVYEFNITIFYDEPVQMKHLSPLSIQSSGGVGEFLISNFPDIESFDQDDNEFTLKGVPSFSNDCTKLYVILDSAGHQHPGQALISEMSFVPNISSAEGKLVTLYKIRGLIIENSENIITWFQTANFITGNDLNFSSSFTY